MFSWFSNNAPIRLKFRVLLLIYGSVAVAAIATTYLAAIAPREQAGLYPYIAGALAVITITVTLYSGKAISDPYVATVVRTEALAAGDLDGAIPFTDHRDCVGRLTRALSVFRDNAQDMAAARAAQEIIVTALGPVSDGSRRAISAAISTTRFPANTNNCAAITTPRSTR